ncbi:MAG TPA: sugar phosphate isomerase/epimerase family protein [Prolixibacteraceae bacterium]|nr:sugar phosphate isomerase/epimerase family protein [Prolixibacteraceae bacterium]
MLTRRNLFKTAGLASIGALLPTAAFTKPKDQHSSFRYCLNTSTIRGQKPGLLKYIEIASEAGYDGVELWVEDVKKHLEAGNSATSLKKYIDDRELKVENAIGFAPWLMGQEGMDQMKSEMEMMASIGCTRIAAPAFGVPADQSFDLMAAGQKYKQLIELGRQTGVMPLLEFWGASKVLYNISQAMMIASAANDPDVKILADVYHMFRGNSGYDTLKMLRGQVIEVFHMNDFVASIPREAQQDKDRVYPGEGAAPMLQILTDLKNMGGVKVLSLELFNETYWKQDALLVAQTGLQKMKELVSRVV